MLGRDGFDKDSPAFNRAWLKEKILTDLPGVSPVLQKDRRKSAVIYAPESLRMLREQVALCYQERRQ